MPTRVYPVYDEKSNWEETFYNESTAVYVTAAGNYYCTYENEVLNQTIRFEDRVELQQSGRGVLISGGTAKWRMQAALAICGESVFIKKKDDWEEYDFEEYIIIPEIDPQVSRNSCDEFQAMMNHNYGLTKIVDGVKVITCPTLVVMTSKYNPDTLFSFSGYNVEYLAEHIHLIVKDEDGVVYEVNLPSSIPMYNHSYAPHLATAGLIEWSG